MDTVKIGKRAIGENQPVFIIAEIGINHGGDLDMASSLVKEAARCGASAAKIQTYNTDKRVRKDSPIYGILKKCELTPRQHKELFDIAKKEGIILFSTPFDEESVDLLVELGSPALKIASFDIVNLRLLAYASNKRSPLIVSTGMADKKEIDKAVAIMNKDKARYCLLHCISAYPTKEEDANLNVIRSLRDNYECPIGYSDHTLGINAPVLAVACGAMIIEKHFTLDKNLKGPDHKLSVDPEDLRHMIGEIRKVEKILGSGEIRVFEAEKGTLIYRRPSLANEERLYAKK